MGIPPQLAPMIDTFWENPMINQMVGQFAFMPRPAEKAPEGSIPGVTDGDIEVAEGVTLGYRLYNGATMAEDALPTVLVFHHGNAELASENHAIERLYGLGCALLAIDYRGFGWSTGAPNLPHLCPDADQVAGALEGILSANGLAGAKKVLWGRSIGATCAVHLAARHAGLFEGIIVESGLMDIKTLPMVAQMSMMFGGPALLNAVADPLGTIAKLPEVSLPALVIHGSADEIVPVAQGRTCHENMTSADKTLKIFEGGDHNSLSHMFKDEYEAAFADFILKFK